MNENLDPNLTAENVDKEQIESNKEEVVIEKSLPKNNLLTKDEILQQLKNLVSTDVIPSRHEVESLKQAYYKLRNEAVETEKLAFVESGNDALTFIPTIDPSEDVVKEFLKSIKEKRAKQIAVEDASKEENYNKKLVIIEKIKELTESSDDFNKLYKKFKDLQYEWTQITLIPQSKTKELWQSYQIYTEKFYDLIKINNEFRDYDFKKNLELKKTLCESVEKLLEESDIISAFHQLQNFHNQWREVGPVSKELREELWTRFKAASTEINKKYQEYFEGLKDQEESNLIKKREICDQLKNIDFTKLTTFKLWDDESKDVIGLQAKWKTIGFVPKKFNNQIFEEFRRLCDNFFEQKSEFFKGVKDEMLENLEKKRVLCQQAIDLKDSTDWKNTTVKLVKIQQEWKKVGAVPRKYSDAIWKEFVGACDYFFEHKKQNDSSHKEEESTNLDTKKEIIEKIKNLASELPIEEAIKGLHALADEWHKIGFVPFKEKDKIYKEFHKAMDDQYDLLKIDKAERRFESFKSSVLDNLSKLDNPEKALYKERDYLVRQYNKIKSDLQTYENNMSFLSISSKKGNSLLNDVNHKIEDLRRELTLIEKKVQAIDENIQNIKN